MPNTPINYGDGIVCDHRKRVIEDNGTFFPNSAAHTLDTNFRKGLPVPSLSMNCTAGKAEALYSLYPTSGDGDFTVARIEATPVASFINKRGLIEIADSNIPRFDYSGGKPALLLEPSGENLIIYPKSFDNNYWIKSGVTIDDNGGSGYTSPSIDYPTSAYKLVANE